MEPRPARLEVRLFGSPEFVFDGEPWLWSALPRCLPLLALLVAARRTPWTRATLAATLWPEELDSDARSNLRRHLNRLQHALPQVEGVEWIAAEGATLAWNENAPAYVDVRAFEELTAADRGAEAIDAYRGDLLEGNHDECVLAERERLRNLSIDLLGNLAREARLRRDFGAASDLLERLLNVDEWREEGVREYMSAKYEFGDRSGALALYERFARRLREEFSAEPMIETTSLRDTIRAGLPLAREARDALSQAGGESSRRSWRLPLIGRQEELERLRTAWSRAAHGSGSLVFLSGEPGIGKSRLASELVAVVCDQGGHTLVGTTSNPEGQPYQPIVTALRAALGHVGGAPLDVAWLSALTDVLPEIRSLRSDLVVEELPAGLARARLFEAIVRLVEYVGRLRPLCIVLEDLHWAGPATVDLLGTLARRLGTLPVLAIVTYRSGEATAGHPLRALRTQLVQERRAIALPLERLDRAEVEAVLQTAEMDPGVPVAERIARLSDGNPLFAVQLLESYRETHEFPDEASALRSVGDAIAARARRLDAHVRAVAEVAAIIGEHFEADMVAEAGGWDENAVLDALGELMDRALVRESSGGVFEYAFTHALVAASFYQESDVNLRPHRHRRVASILERTRSVDAAALASIARHWQHAGEPRRASAAYVDAARAALGVYARDEAIAFAEAACDMADNDRARFAALAITCEARLSYGNLEHRSCDVARIEAVAAALGYAERFSALRFRERYVMQVMDAPACRQTIEDLFALAAESQDRNHRAYAHFAKGYFAMQVGQLDEARADLRAALHHASKAENAEIAASAREELIGVLLRCDELAEAAKELEVQRAYVRERGMPALATLRLLSAESTVASIVEDTDALERIGAEMLELAVKTGDVYLEGKAHFLLLQSSGLRFDPHSLQTHYASAIRCFDALNEIKALAATHHNAACMLTIMGLGGEARLALEQSDPLGERVRSTDGAFMQAITLAQILLFEDRAEDCLAQARLAHEMSLELVEARFLDESMNLLGAAEWRNGLLDLAIEHLMQAIARAATRGAGMQVSFTQSYLIAALVDAGRLDEAAVQARGLERLLDEAPRSVKYPTLAHWSLMKLASARCDDAEHDRWLACGRRALRERLERLGEPKAVEAYACLPFNRPLLP